MNELLTSPYVVVVLAVVVGVVIWKLIDQKRDRRQKDFQTIGETFTRLGWDEAGSTFKALAIDGYEEFVSRAKAMLERLRSPGGVENVMATAVVKAINDHDFQQSQAFKQLVEPALAERALGFVLDDSTQAQLALLAPTLQEYGSIEFANLFTALGANKLDQAKMHFQAIITLLRDKERLDDELVKRMVKALPRAVQADPAHYAALKAIFDKISPPAAAPAVATMR